jgi:hypothetical protein
MTTNRVDMDCQFMTGNPQPTQQVLFKQFSYASGVWPAVTA